MSEPFKHPTPEWVPLAEHVDGDRFRLSRQVLALASPLCGWWTVKSLVARLISYFEDPFEHLLDFHVYEEDEDQGVFSVNPERCEGLASQFHSEFYPLSPTWYRQLFIAKLISLRVPASLLVELKLGCLMKTWDSNRVIEAVLQSTRAKHIGMPASTMARLRSALNAPPREAWPVILEVVEPILNEDSIFCDEFEQAYVILDTE